VKDIAVMSTIKGLGGAIGVTVISCFKYLNDLNGEEAGLSGDKKPDSPGLYPPALSAA
jgi:hypothetical protein